MAILAFREVSGRTLTHRFGEPPTAERKFVVTHDNTAHNVSEVAGTIGIFHGDPHPEFTYITMTEAVMVEGSPSPFHCEVTFRYELIQPDERAPNPLARADTWSFSTGGATVPALFYFDGSTSRPLVNSAKDYFEGLTTDEAECRASISGNRQSFPLAMAVGVTNCVNNSTYLGAPAHHWKCVGVSGQQQIELVNGVEIRYWSITTELIYRQTGWNLFLPNVGYNYFEDSKKKRAYVEFEGERIPSANPVPLNANGSLKEANELPDILERRVCREVNFSSYFGQPAWL